MFKKSGFSLLEMILVIIIISILFLASKNLFQTPNKYLVDSEVCINTIQGKLSQFFYQGITGKDGVISGVNYEGNNYRFNFQFNNSDSSSIVLLISTGGQNYLPVETISNDNNIYGPNLLPSQTVYPNQNVIITPNVMGYTKVVSNQTTSSPGGRIGGASLNMPVNVGETYLYKLYGYSSGSGQGRLYVGSNLGMLLRGSQSAPTTPGIMQTTFTIPAGVTTINILGLLFYSIPHFGSELYIKDAGLYKVINSSNITKIASCDTNTYKVILSGSIFSNTGYIPTTGFSIDINKSLNNSLGKPGMRICNGSNCSGVFSSKIDFLTCKKNNGVIDMNSCRNMYSSRFDTATQSLKTNRCLNALYNQPCTKWSVDPSIFNNN